MSLYVCVSPLQSQLTFDMLVGSARNFQGLLNSSQVIFGRVTRTPGPLGSGPDPKKRVSAESISSEGFGVGGSCLTFTETGRQGEQNVGSGILIFGLLPEKTGPESRSCRGANQNFGILTFFIKGPPLNLGAGRFLFYPTF